jgi:hypothetical protein
MCEILGPILPIASARFIFSFRQDSWYLKLQTLAARRTDKLLY